MQFSNPIFPFLESIYLCPSTYLSFYFSFCLILTFYFFYLFSTFSCICFLQTIGQSTCDISFFSDKFVGPDRAVLVGNPWVSTRGKAFPFLLVPLLLFKTFISLLSLSFFPSPLPLFLFLCYSFFLPFFFPFEDYQNFSGATTKLNESQINAIRTRRSDKHWHTRHILVFLNLL